MEEMPMPYRIQVSQDFYSKTSILTPSDGSHIRLHDLVFEPWISETVIRDAIHSLAGQLIKQQLPRPLFMGILQGSYVFMSDLVRAYGADCEMDWLRVQSYEGTESTEQLKWLAEPSIQDFSEYDVVLVEDIIDSGFTLHEIYKHFSALRPRSIQIVSLLRKPKVVRYELPRCTVGIDIDDHFVVGYGLDYRELGRNLRSVYRCVQ